MFQSFDGYVIDAGYLSKSEYDYFFLKRPQNVD